MTEQEITEQIDAMLSENTEGFMWALANMMADRSSAIASENILPLPLQRANIKSYSDVGLAAYEFAKRINPSRA